MPPVFLEFSYILLSSLMCPVFLDVFCAERRRLSRTRETQQNKWKRHNRTQQNAGDTAEHKRYSKINGSTRDTAKHKRQTETHQQHKRQGRTQDTEQHTSKHWEHREDIETQGTQDTQQNTQKHYIGTQENTLQD